MEGEKVLLTIFLESIDYKELISNPINREKIMPKTRIEFFLKKLNESMNQSAFLDYFPQILEHIGIYAHLTVAELLSELNKFFKLNSVQQILFGLACSLSQNRVYAADGARFNLKKIFIYFYLDF